MHVRLGKLLVNLVTCRNYSLWWSRTLVFSWSRARTCWTAHLHKCSVIARAGSSDLWLSKGPLMVALPFFQQ